MREAQCSDETMHTLLLADKMSNIIWSAGPIIIAAKGFALVVYIIAYVNFAR